MMTRTLLPLLVCSFFLTAGCEQLPLEATSCPCGSGWVCCEDQNLCAPSADECVSASLPGEADAAPDSPDAESSATAAHTVFLNFEGATISPGDGPASADESPIVTAPTAIPPFKAAPFATSASREQVVADLIAAVEALYAPFDVAFTDVRPTTGDYVMVMLGGSRSHLGLPPGAWAAAPLDCESDAYNVAGDREIAFILTDDVPAANYADQVRITAVTIARQLGHTFGLERSTNCRDVMSPIGGCGDQSFLDLDTSCPSCTCASNGIQNTFQILSSVLGN